MKKLILLVAAAIMIVGATPLSAQNTGEGEKWLLYLTAFSAGLAAIVAVLNSGKDQPDSP